MHVSMIHFKGKTNSTENKVPLYKAKFFNIQNNSGYTDMLYSVNLLSLKVTEIYSSGGDLHLELPSGQAEAPPEHWVCICGLYW